MDLKEAQEIVSKGPGPNNPKFTEALGFIQQHNVANAKLQDQKAGFSAAHLTTDGKPLSQMLLNPTGVGYGTPFVAPKRKALGPFKESEEAYEARVDAAARANLAADSSGSEANVYAQFATGSNKDTIDKLKAKIVTIIKGDGDYAVIDKAVDGWLNSGGRTMLQANRTIAAEIGEQINGRIRQLETANHRIGR